MIAIVLFIIISINFLSTELRGESFTSIIRHFSGVVRFPFTCVRFHFQSFNYVVLLVDVNFFINQLLQYFRIRIYKSLRDSCGVRWESYSSLIDVILCRSESAKNCANGYSDWDLFHFFPPLIWKALHTKRVTSCTWSRPSWYTKTMSLW